MLSTPPQIVAAYVFNGGTHMERNTGKRRLLMLLRLLLEQTDEEHPLSTAEIVALNGELIIDPDLIFAG